MKPLKEEDAQAILAAAYKAAAEKKEHMARYPRCLQGAGNRVRLGFHVLPDDRFLLRRCA